MRAEDLIRYLGRIHYLQGVTIRFAEDGIVGMARLYGEMQNSRLLSTDQSSMTLMAAVMGSNHWGGARNRSITFYGLGRVANDLLKEVAKDIEDIAVGEHGAKALMSGRDKRRKEAADQIISDVLSAELVAEVESWGFYIEGHLGYLDTIPCVEFWLTRNNGGELLATFILDGWSGRMAVDLGSQLGNEQYVRPEQMQALIRKTMEAKADELTAAA